MRKRLNKIIMAFIGACLVGTIAGCDEAGIFDIVNGSAQLAYGIIDVAT